jgi:predicted nucleic acid-binding protein
VRQESYLRHRETRGDDVVGRRAVTSTDGMTAAYDLLLAACALRRGLKIVTHNARELVRVGGLGLEDWHSR